MWLKLVGSILIIVASISIGFSYAKRFGERPRQIRQIISCFTVLSSYINYAALPLSEALIKCTYGNYGWIESFFRRVACLLEREPWMAPQDAFREALSELEQHLALEQPEREILLSLSANLGVMNREEQEKCLVLALEQLRQIELQAVSLRDPNMKMYRYLGICGGLTVVILLV